MSLKTSKNEGNTTNIQSKFTPDERRWQSYCQTVLLLPNLSFGIPNANVLLNAHIEPNTHYHFFASGIKGLAFLFLSG
jgi:hypothetical protein